jgi:DNA mismatch repair ATPase MutS
VRDGEFIIFREGLPETLPASLHVVRETPAYLLCEIALDAGALAALEARDAAAREVAACEEAVRARLSATVAAAAPEFDRARAAFGELDVLVARALFARRYACTPAHVAASGRITLEGMRYLPLSEALAERGRTYAPLSFTLEGIGVVTGPNMGGKTAALKTVGFAAACVALGVPVPALSASVPLFDEIAWLGIGARAAGGEEEPLLSSFGSELEEVRALLARAPQRPLVLIDEFARTTSPPEGRALLIALLETLGSHGALALAATHLAGVARAARAGHYTSGRLRPLPAPPSPVRLDEALARLGEAMDYGLTRSDEAGSAVSDAIALAEILGLDTAFTQRARDVLRNDA